MSKRKLKCRDHQVDARTRKVDRNHLFIKYPVCQDTFLTVVPSPMLDDDFNDFLREFGGSQCLDHETKKIMCCQTKKATSTDAMNYRSDAAPKKLGESAS